MKTLLLALTIILGLTAVALAEPRTYTFHTTGRVLEPGGVPSCGKTVRKALRNTERPLLVEDGRAWSINTVAWKDMWGDSTAPGWAYLTYAFATGHYDLKIITNDRGLIGTLTRMGVRDGKRCRDTVRIKGAR